MKTEVKQTDISFSELVKSLGGKSVEEQNKILIDIIKRLAYPYFGYPFICGQGGEVDQNGLPDRIFVCPAYGVDWFEVYERKNLT